ncbi:MAG: HEAT repeat domain-containing protein [Candidatus Poribacteria bacterium]|nr:HEAT repeat domain-containing protein [Candidatus Poribacteria bacterium]
MRLHFRATKRASERWRPALGVTALLTLGVMLSFSTGCEVDRVKFNRLEEAQRFLAAGEPFQAAAYFEESIEKELETKSKALAYLAVAHDQSMRRVRSIETERVKYEQKRDERLSEIRKDPVAIQYLVGILENHDQTSQSAIELLVTLGVDAADALINGYGEMKTDRDVILGIFQRVGDPVIPALQAAVSGRVLDTEQKIQYVRLIGDIDAEGSNSFLTTIRNDQMVSEGVRTAAAAELYKHGEKGERDFLLAQLNSTDTLSRRSASYAMSYLNDKPASNVLINHLGDENAFVRMNIVRALKVHQGGAEAITALLNTLRNDADNGVANEAVAALSQYGIPVLAPALDALEKEPEWTRRQRLVQVLGADEVRKGFTQNLEFRLYEFYRKEQQQQVQGDLARLLDLLEADKNK